MAKPKPAPKKGSAKPPELDVGFPDEEPAKPDKANAGVVIYRSPCEYYIKYLLSIAEGDQIAPVLRQLHAEKVLLPVDEVGYLKGLAEVLENGSPDPFMPHELRHGPSQEFLQSEGIWSLWHPDRAVTDALRAFRNLPVRQDLNGMMISGLTPEHICWLMSRHHAAIWYTPSVGLFRHYFWNMHILGYDEREQVYSDVRAGGTPLRRAFQSRGSTAGQREMLWDMGYPVSLPTEEMVQDQIRSLVSEMSTHFRDYRPEDFKSLSMLRQAAGVKVDVGMSVTAMEAFNPQFRTTSAMPASELSRPGMQPKQLPGRERNLKLIKKEGEDAEGPGHRSVG